MAKTYRNSAEVLAERAMHPGKAAPCEFPADDTIKPEPRRLIYNGTMPIPPQADLPPGTSLPKNRRFTKRSVSPFNIILLLMGAAAAIVLYIGNIIAVDQLVNDIHKSELRLQDIVNEQELLRARINQMSSLDRIRSRATEELGLKDPSGAPGWMTVDPEKIRMIEESTHEH